mmetsp:Transcript_6221/g.8142  ORF Transcript_6221/g.8142 Transcript_6221/m.8142 type:complete len:154 (-) Transcript_6221:377-838(-)
MCPALCISSSFFNAGRRVLCPAAWDEIPMTWTSESSACSAISSGVWNSGPTSDIPNLDNAIIGTTENTRLIPTRIIIHTIDTPLVPLQRIMRHSTPQPPDLNTAIQTSTRKRIRILGIELDLHHIMRMPLKELSAFKSTIPIPELDRHIVRRR